MYGQIAFRAILRGCNVENKLGYIFNLHYYGSYLFVKNDTI